jgi:hypothetical protein
MSDREPTTPPEGTGELPPTEPVEPRRTEPIDPGDPSPPPPPGGYASIGGRRGGPTLPVRLVVVGAVVLVLVFVLGFFVGRGQAPEPGAGRDRTEQAGQQGQGGGGKGGKAGRKARRVACRRAVDRAVQLIELQRQAIATQVALTEAIVAEDPEQVEALSTAGEQLQAQIAEAQPALDQAVQRCRG